MKKQKNESAVHDWVSELPFMQQALLMTGMRGPDGCSKYNGAKCIVRFLRGAVLKPAGEIKGNEDSFMWIDYSEFDHYVHIFFDDTDSYPMHFLMHLIHCSEVVGYKHPDENIRHQCLAFYVQACDRFHMQCEPQYEMNKRMNL